MANRIEVQIGGDNKDLNKAIKNSEQSLKNFSKATKGLSSNVGSNLSRGAANMGKFGKQTANAVPAVTEFSRVIQDAPFGIQGVANNITQLTQQFGNLSKKLGGSKQALKAMLGTLAGPAGILLAVSAVTSLMVLFGDTLFKTSNDVDKLNKKLEKLNENFDIDLKLSKEQEALLRLQDKTVSSILEKRQKLIQAQLLSVKTILEEQKAQLSVLKTQNEQIDNFEYIVSLLGLVVGGIIQFTNKIAKSGVDLIAKGLQSALAPLQQLNIIEFDRSKSIKATKKEREKEVELSNQVKKTTTQILSLERQLLENKKEQRTVDLDRGKISPLNITQDTVAVQGLIVNANNLKKAYETTYPQIANAKFSLAESLKLGSQQIKNSIATIPDFIQQKAQETEIALQNFNDRAKMIVDNNIARTFMGIGDAIGNALTGASSLSQGLGKALLGAFGGILTQLGQLAIATGIALTKVSIALKSLNPALAIGAGVALLAIGRAFSSKSAAIGGQIGGGSRSSSGGGSVSSGVSNGTTRNFGSSASFTNSGNGFGEVVFQIRGTDLVGVLSNTLQRNRNLGGQFGNLATS